MAADRQMRQQWERAVYSNGLLQRLLKGRPSVKPFGVYRIDLELNEQSWALPVARLAEAEVFAYYGDTAEELDDEYGLYDPFSTFFVVVDRIAQRLAGMLRIIRRSPIGLKSLTDIESDRPGRNWRRSVSELQASLGVCLNHPATLDMATMGVVPAYHRHAYSGRIAKSIYHMACRYTVEQAATHWVTIVDESAHRSFVQRLGQPFSYYPGVEWQRYLGSNLSLPVWVDIPVWTNRLRATDPRRFAWLFRGEGLQKAFDVPIITGPTPA